MATAKEAMYAAGLNWRLVSKDIPGLGRRLLVRENRGNLYGHGILGSIKRSYDPMQNSDAFSFLDCIVRAKAASYESAGFLGLGEWVWIILRFYEQAEIVPNDPVSKFLLFGNAPTTGHHQLVYLPVRQACHNTLAGGSNHNVSPLVTVARIGPRQFQRSDGYALKEIQSHFAAIINDFRAMAQIKLDVGGMRQYLNKVFNDWIRKNQIVNSKERSLNRLAEFSRGTKECLRLSLGGAGNTLPGAKGTLWAAVNAVCDYVDFQKLNPRDPSYLKEIWFNELKGNALKVAKAMRANIWPNLHR